MLEQGTRHRERLPCAHVEAHGKDTKLCRVPSEAHDKYLTAADAHQRRQPFAVRLHGAHGKE